MTSDRLYPLLPAIYRIRDEAAGAPLRALLAVLASELAVLETDIGDLYDQWFIETCAEWVVPYIGDVLDVRELYVENARLSTFGRQERRAFVANTLAYRRRKGTAPVLEQLTRDLTGWPARVVEVFDRLTTTTHLDHPRRHSGWVDLRQSNRSDQVGTPFEQLAAYTPEVRRGYQGQGRYNQRHINLFLWRLTSYPIERSTARAVLSPTATGNPRCYTFDPIGGSFPLFNQPQPELEITRLAAAINVPGKLRRMALAEELQARAQARWQGQPLPNPSYFGQPNPPVIQVFINGQPRPIPTDEMMITALDAAPPQVGGDLWQLPPPESKGQFPPKVVAIDPEQGRLAFLDGTVPSRVEVSYAYGFSGDVGSGPYEHDPEGAGDAEISAHPLLTWDIEQDNAAAANPLAAAVDQWNRMVQAWESLRRQSAVPLARLVLPDARVVSVPVEAVGIAPPHPLRPQLRPGILKGLMVEAVVGSTQVSLDPGVAVDGQGRVMTIARRETLDLTPYRHPGTLVTDSITVGIGLAYGITAPQWQLHILPEAALNSHPHGSFVLLAQVTIDPHSKQIQNLDLSDRLACAAGLVTGLTVVLNPGQPEVPPPPPPDGIRRDRSTPALTAVITAGLAVDGRGREISLTHNHAVNLRVYQGQTVWLVAACRRRLGQPDGQITVVPEADINQFPATIYLPLAHLQVPTVTADVMAASRSSSQQSSSPPHVQLPTPVNAGIVKGLTVTAGMGDSVVTVAPGTAIDPQAHILQSDIYCRVNLRRYAQEFAHQTVLLVMVAVDAPRPPRWRMQVIAAHDPLAATAIALARLTLNRWGRVAGPIDESMRVPCHPGIVRGLTVTKINPAQVEIAPGVALLNDERLITLDRPCQVDVSAYPDRTLTLFIGDQTDAGWPRLRILSPKLGPGWHHIGLVPEEPANAKTGVITVRDHRTYVGDLTVIIPTRQQLWLRSAGTRPHLLGNLTVQGVNSTLDPTSSQPGAFTLDGWLVEGQLTVSAGQLKRLHVRHSTLVPQAGGLVVAAAIAPLPADGTAITNWAIALVMYWINQIQRVIGLGLEVGGRSPQQNLGALLDLAQQQVGPVFTSVQQLFQPEEPCLSDLAASGPLRLPGWASDQNKGENENPALNDPPTNHQLQISLDRSICGAIHLPDTIPTLSITDSIVDRVNAADGAAILAPGTDVAIKTTTVFGRTLVASIAASDSIFTGKVTTQRRQIGYLRFCYVPANSQTPRRYRCQPDLALSEALDRLPAPIAALAVDSNTGLIWAGTAGNGIFRSADEGQTWTLSSPANLHVTTLFAQTKLGTGTIASRDRLVIGSDTALPRELKVDDQITVLVNRPEGDQSSRVQQSRSVTARYITLNAAFIPDLSLGVPFAIQRAATGRISSLGTTITGSGTAFISELRVGDQLQVGAQSRTITAITSATKLTVDNVFPANLPLGTGFARLRPGSGRMLSNGNLISVDDATFNAEINVGDQIIAASQTRTVTGLAATIAAAFPTDLPAGTTFSITRSGRGTLTSQGPKVTGAGTQFATDLKLGDAIAVIVADRVQIRTVIAFDANSPATGLMIDAAFNPDLAAATPFTVPGQTVLYAGLSGGEMLRSPDGGDTWVNLDLGEINTDIVALVAPTPTALLIATAGDGVWQGSGLPQQPWVATNVGLTNQHLTGLAVSAQGRVFAGTAGGVFRRQPGTQQWVAVNGGLTDRQITALAIDADGRVCVGTQSGQIWRSTDHGNLWTRVYNGAVGVDISALLADTEPGMGTITSQGTQVTGTGTQFQRELPVGSTLRVHNQVRIVTAVATATALTLNAAFAADVTTATAFSRNLLLVGTANGKIWQSIDNGHKWVEVYRDLTQTDITGLAKNALLLAGTAVGNVLINQADRWISSNDGLINVEEKLLILDRLQPQFTTRHYGDAGYAQLSLTGAPEIRTGAEDGSEMGPFNYLQQPQREAALRVSLEEYLRFGLELGIFYST